MSTQADLAKHLDLSTRQIRHLVEQNVLPASRQRSGGYDLDDCRTKYLRHLRAIVSGQRNRPTGTYEEERTRLTRAQADKAEAEAQRERGELLDAAEVERAWASLVTAARAKLLALPPKVASRAIASRDHREVLEFVREEIHAVLDELAGAKNPE